MSDYRDRNEGYIPTGMPENPMPRMVEVDDGGDGRREPRMAPMVWGDADELNRDPRQWMWARVDQETEDGVREHWSRFDGHIVQVDIEMHTSNRREVNDWKGRDEVRKGGVWTLKLNRIPVFSGHVYDPLEALLEIRRTLKQLLSHECVINDWTEEGINKALLGRKIFYREQPAVITSHLLEHEGRIVVRPDGKPEFSPPCWDSDGICDNDEVVTTLLDPNIYWWRD